MSRLARGGAALLATFALLGCREERTESLQFPPADTVDTAVAPGMGPAGTDTMGMGTGPAGAELQIELIGRDGQPVGTARLSQQGDAVRIALEARDLPPGPRGIHFHETGRCEAPGFQSAGAHFNPTGRQHGLENPQGPHAGDMENLEVEPDGRVNTTLSTTRVTLREGQPYSLLDADGAALVIHAERDDQRSDPSGNSGDRIACGVIRRT